MSPREGNPAPSLAVAIEGEGPIASALRDALAAIDSVHGAIGLPTIPARANPRLRQSTHGRYLAIIPTPIAIELNPSARHPAFVAAHEIGHFLDHRGLGTDGFGFASSSDHPNTKPVMDAIAASREARTISRIANIMKEGAGGQFSKLAKLEEMFARAYAQYIAVKSGRPAVLVGLAHDRGDDYVRLTGKRHDTADAQWSDRAVVR